MLIADIPSSKDRQVFKNIIDKIFFNGYNSVDAISTETVVARYARGNTSVQDKRYLNSSKLKKLLNAGDRAAKRLEKRAKRAKI